MTAGRKKPPRRRRAYWQPSQVIAGAHIPRFLLRYPHLSPGAKLCYAYLTHYPSSRADGLAFPQQSTMAEELAVHTRQIKRYVAELTRDQNGIAWIERDANPDNLRANVYRFPINTVIRAAIVGEQKRSARKGTAKRQIGDSHRPASVPYRRRRRGAATRSEGPVSRPRRPIQRRLRLPADPPPVSPIDGQQGTATEPTGDTTGQQGTYPSPKLGDTSVPYMGTHMSPNIEPKTSASDRNGSHLHAAETSGESYRESYTPPPEGVGVATACAIRAALAPIVGIDADAAKAIAEESHRKAPDATPEEIAAFTLAKAKQIQRRKNVRNFAGLLIEAAPKSITAEALAAFRAVRKPAAASEPVDPEADRFHAWMRAQGISPANGAEYFAAEDRWRAAGKPAA